MKPAELKTLINECVREVMNEEKATKKKAALKKIQEIISENEIEETEVNELFGSKPASDQELDAYLAKNPKLKASLDKTEQKAITLKENGKKGGRPKGSKTVVKNPSTTLKKSINDIKSGENLSTYSGKEYLSKIKKEFEKAK